MSMSTVSHATNGITEKTAEVEFNDLSTNNIKFTIGVYSVVTDSSNVSYSYVASYLFNPEIGIVHNIYLTKRNVLFYNKSNELTNFFYIEKKIS